jgi:N-acetylglucosamine kinase-like BadF-type ATPase
MAKVYLGVDTGGSKSHALLVDAAGRILALAQAGCGNPDLIGYEGLARLLHELSAGCLQQAGVEGGRVGAACFGISGLDWDSQVPAARQAVESLGLDAPVEMLNDMLLGLYAGAPQGWGIVVGAGTSCNCRGRDASGREGRMVGYGELFAEYAGAVEIVNQAVRAVALEWTRRGPPTQLTPALVRLAGAADAAAMLEGLALERIHLPASAALAVVEEARRGDAVAQELLRWAGGELAGMAIGVARQLDFAGQAFDVVMMGSFFAAGELLRAPFQAAVLAQFPLARFVPLKVYPVAGAALRALQLGGLETGALRPAVIEHALRLGLYPAEMGSGRALMNTDERD